MLSHLAQRFSISIARTKFYLLLMGVSAGYLYFLSPNRYPALSKILIPDGFSQFWSLRLVCEDYGTIAAFTLVGLLASLIRSTEFYLLLTGATALFVYMVSPTREPDFVKFPTHHAGSLIWWLEGMNENHWTLVAIILAALLAINLTLDLWQWCQPKRRYFVMGTIPFVICLGLWLVLLNVFFHFLVRQWLI